MTECASGRHLSRLVEVCRERNAMATQQVEATVCLIVRPNSEEGMLLKKPLGKANPSLTVSSTSQRPVPIAISWLRACRAAGAMLLTLAVTTVLVHAQNPTEPEQAQRAKCEADVLSSGDSANTPPPDNIANSTRAALACEWIFNPEHVLAAFELLTSTPRAPHDPDVILKVLKELDAGDPDPKDQQFYAAAMRNPDAQGQAPPSLELLDVLSKANTLKPADENALSRSTAGIVAKTNEGALAVVDDLFRGGNKYAAFYKLLQAVWNDDHNASELEQLRATFEIYTDALSEQVEQQLKQDRQKNCEADFLNSGNTPDIVNGTKAALACEWISSPEDVLAAFELLTSTPRAPHDPDVTLKVLKQLDAGDLDSTDQQFYTAVMGNPDAQGQPTAQLLLDLLDTLSKANTLKKKPEDKGALFSYTEGIVDKTNKSALAGVDDLFDRKDDYAAFYKLLQAVWTADANASELEQMRAAFAMDTDELAEQVEKKVVTHVYNDPCADKTLKPVQSCKYPTPSRRGSPDNVADGTKLALECEWIDTERGEVQHVLNAFSMLVSGPQAAGVAKAVLDELGKRDHPLDQSFFQAALGDPDNYGEPRVQGLPNFLDTLAKANTIIGEGQNKDADEQKIRLFSCTKDRINDIFRASCGIAESCDTGPSALAKVNDAFNQKNNYVALYELLNAAWQRYGNANDLEKLRAAFQVDVDLLAKQVAAAISPPKN
jgi:hypothetical protein